MCNVRMHCAIVDFDNLELMWKRSHFWMRSSLGLVCECCVYVVGWCDVCLLCAVVVCVVCLVCGVVLCSVVCVHVVRVSALFVVSLCGVAVLLENVCLVRLVLTNVGVVLCWCRLEKRFFVFFVVWSVVFEGFFGVSWPFRASMDDVLLLVRHGWVVCPCLFCLCLLCYFRPFYRAMFDVQSKCLCQTCAYNVANFSPCSCAELSYSFLKFPTLF